VTYIKVVEKTLFLGMSPYFCSPRATPKDPYELARKVLKRVGTPAGLTGYELFVAHGMAEGLPGEIRRTKWGTTEGQTDSGAPAGTD
jgi:hypothetical protein